MKRGQFKFFVIFRGKMEGLRQHYEEKFSLIREMTELACDSPEEVKRLLLDILEERRDMLASLHSMKEEVNHWSRIGSQHIASSLLIDVIKPRESTATEGVMKTKVVCCDHCVFVGGCYMYSRRYLQSTFAFSQLIVLLACVAIPWNKTLHILFYPFSITSLLQLFFQVY